MDELLGALSVQNDEKDRGLGQTEQLKGECARLRAQLGGRDRDLASVREMYKQATEAAESAAEQAASHKQEAGSLHQSVIELKARLTEVQKAHAGCPDDNARLMRELAEVVALHRPCNEQLARLRAQLRDFSNESLSRYNELGVSHSALTEDTNQLQERVVWLTGKLETSAGREMELEGDIAALNERVAQLTADNGAGSEWRSRHDAVQQELSDSRARATEVAARFEANRQAWAQTEATLCAQLAQFEERCNKLSEREETMVVVQKKAVAESRQLHAQAIEDVTIREEKLGEVEAECERLKTLLKKLESDKRESQEDSQRQKEQLQQLQQQLEQESERAAALEGQLAALVATKDEAQQLQHQLDQEFRRASKLEEQLTALQKTKLEAQQLQERLDQESGRVAALEEQLAALEKTKSEAMSSASRDVDAKARSLAEVQEQVVKLEAQHRFCGATIKKQQESEADLQSQLDQLGAEHKGCAVEQQRLKTHTEEISKQHAGCAGALEQQRAQLIASSKKREDDYAKNIRGLEDELEDMRAQLQAKDDAMETADTVIQELQHRYKAQLSACELLQVRMKDLQSSHESEQSRQSNQDDIVKRLKTALQEAMTAHEGCYDASQQQAAEIYELSRQLEEAETVHAGCAHRVDDLTAQITAAEAAHEGCDMATRRQAEELVAASARWTEAVDEHKGCAILESMLRDEIQALADAHAGCPALEKRLRDEHSGCADKIHKAEGEIVSLNAKLCTAADALGDWEGRYSLLVSRQKEANETKGGLASRLQELEEELAKMTAAFHRAQADLRETQAAHGGCDLLIANLRSQLEIAIREHESCAQVLQEAQAEAKSFKGGSLRLAHIEVERSLASARTARLKMKDDAKQIVHTMEPVVGIVFLNGPQEGVLVEAVRPGQPAEECGLRATDVIESVNGHAVRTKDDFKEAMNGVRPGDDVYLQVFRYGNMLHRLRIRLTVGAKGFELHRVRMLRRLAEHDEADFSVDLKVFDSSWASKQRSRPGSPKKKRSRSPKKRSQGGEHTPPAQSESGPQSVPPTVQKPTSQRPQRPAPAPPRPLSQASLASTLPSEEAKEASPFLFQQEPPAKKLELPAATKPMGPRARTKAAAAHRAAINKAGAPSTVPRKTRSKSRSKDAEKPRFRA